MELLKQKTKSKFSISNASHLYLNGKDLVKIDLKNHKNLKIIYLHNNKIKEIKGLQQMVNLTHLFLQWNDIDKIENLNNLFNLQKLYLSYNKIEKLENIGNLKKLKELHLNNQKLPDDKEFTFDYDSIKGLSNNLEHLNISKLNLTTLDGIKDLSNLRFLNASSNNFYSIDKIADSLKSLVKLENLVLNGCPAQKDLYYRDKVTAAVYDLESLDEKDITRNNRIFIKALEKRKLERQQKLEQGDSSKLDKTKLTSNVDNNYNLFKFDNEENSSELGYQRFSEDYRVLLYQPYSSLSKLNKKT